MSSSTQGTTLSDTRPRCTWVKLTLPLYVHYHDEEWGVPIHDDQTHFQFLILEGAQAGLSWETILKKRAGYRRAFADFDPEQVARFSDDQLKALANNSEIVRNRLKIHSARTNAQIFCAIQKECGSFDSYIWSFVGGRPKQNSWQTLAEVPTTTAESDALSKDLRARGMRFVGPTIMYSHLQATGLVNDHTTDCWRYPICAQLADR